MSGKRVCVFGSYKRLKEAAHIVKLGYLLGKRGYIVVTGGFGGTMEDVSRGAKKAGTKTIGVTYYKPNDSRKRPNPYVDEEIKTDNIFERISTMMKISDAFIVLPGGTGTLLELASCLECINKGIIEIKPVVAFGSFWKKVVSVLGNELILNKGIQNKFGLKKCAQIVKFCTSPEDVVSSVEILCRMYNEEYTG